MTKSITKKVKCFIRHSGFSNVGWLDYIQDNSWHEKQLIRFIQKIIREEKLRTIKPSGKEV